MKKVDFFREWAKQFEPGYKGPWMIDNVKPDDLFFCGCCLDDLFDTDESNENN